jgi:hypothetical protein
VRGAFFEIDEKEDEETLRLLRDLDSLDVEIDQFRGSLQ